MALRYIFTVTLLVLGLSTLSPALGRTTDVAMSKGNLEHSREGYAWVHFNITSESPNTLVIKNSITQEGKWCSFGDQDRESPSPDGTRIDNTLPQRVYACGSPSDPIPEAIGSFEIWEDKPDGKQACAVVFQNFWQRRILNFYYVETIGEDYFCINSGGSLTGPIGDVAVSITGPVFHSVI